MNRRKRTATQRQTPLTNRHAAERNAQAERAAGLIGAAVQMLPIEFDLNEERPRHQPDGFFGLEVQRVVRRLDNEVRLEDRADHLVGMTTGEAAPRKDRRARFPQTSEGGAVRPSLEQ